MTSNSKTFKTQFALQEFSGAQEKGKIFCSRAFKKNFPKPVVATVNNTRAATDQKFW